MGRYWHSTLIVAIQTSPPPKLHNIAFITLIGLKRLRPRDTSTQIFPTRVKFNSCFIRDKRPGYRESKSCDLEGKQPSIFRLQNLPLGRNFRSWISVSRTGCLKMRGEFSKESADVEEKVNPPCNSAIEGALDTVIYGEPLRIFPNARNGE